MSFIDGLATFYTDIGSILASWDQIGIFSIVLPFLLIFAVVFAILDRLALFKDKRGINMIVSIAVGLLALYLPIVSDFFSVIFPRLGVGIAVILVAMILIAAFLPEGKDSWLNYILFGLGALIFIIVVLGSFTNYYWWDSGWWTQYYSGIVVLLIIAVVIAIVVFAGRKTK